MSLRIIKDENGFYVELPKDKIKFVSKEAEMMFDLSLENDYLQQENQELKAKIKTYEEPDDLTLMFMYCDEKAKDKIKELKKQNEEYKRLGFKHLQNRNNELENQQKEFIEYMNKTIEELECDDVDDEEMKGYLIQRIDTFKEILSKYKSIIGASYE